ncbi:MAG: polysaccharide biosynthesis tyrosine autokinase, partial [Dehalococcoidia bacterium]
MSGRARRRHRQYPCRPRWGTLPMARPGACTQNRVVAETKAIRELGSECRAGCLLRRLCEKARATKGGRMDAARYIAIVKRWWWLLIVGTLIAVAAFGVASRVRDRGAATTEYAASTTLFVSDPQPAPGTQPSAVASDRLMRSYAAMITGKGVAERIIERLGLRASIDDVRGHISVALPPGTQLIEITTTGTTPGEAETLSGGVIQSFLALHDEGRVPGSATVTAVTPAAETQLDTRPQWQTALLVAAFGLLSAASIIVIFEYLTDTVRDAADAEAAAGVPVLASVPMWSAGRGGRFATAFAGRGAAQACEAFRMLRTAVRMATQDRPVQTLLFTAAGRSAGTTTAAANYAHALAQAGRRVIIVDANLREPAQHRMFDAEATPGLAEALAVRDVPLDAIVQATSIEGVSLVAAGLCPANPTELLDSQRFDELLGELRQRFDAIVIDSPPAPGTADATQLAGRADAAIVVVRADHTSRANASAAVATLRQTSTRVIGALLNGGTGGMAPAVARERN